MDLQAYLARESEILNVTPLAISRAHVFEVARLPMHHRDPFDRLLIAQAIVEKIPIVSADSAFDAFGVDRIW